MLVNLAAAYGQKYKKQKEENADPILLEESRENALKYMSKVLKIDMNDRWLNRLRTLLRTDVQKDPSDNDLEAFENDKEFRDLLGLSIIKPMINH